MPAKARAIRLFANRYLPTLSSAVILGSLFTNGLIQFELFGLNATSWDLAVAWLAGSAAMLLYLNGWKLPAISTPVLALASAFAIWVTISAIRSPQEFRGFTMALLLLRSYAMVFSLLVLLEHVGSIGRLNRLFFLLSIPFAIAALILFLPNADHVASRRPFGSIIILVDEFQVPRITGFANDPNFFALVILMSLFFVFSFGFSLRNAWVWFVVPILFAVLILTFSRAGYAGFGAGMAVISLLLLFIPSRVPWRVRFSSVVLFAAIGAVTFAGLSQLELNKGRSVQDLTALRFERLANSPRFAMWKDLIEGPTTEPMPTVPRLPGVSEPLPAQPTQEGHEIPEAKQPTQEGREIPETMQPEVVAEDGVLQTVFGHGLRSNQVRLGTYSHNSYLDVSEEMGIVGISLWGAIVFFVGAGLLVRAFKDPVVISWIAAYAVVLVMMSSLSMLFMPYFWIIVAVALHVSGREVGQQQGPVAARVQL